jgi:hypothetical protein
MSGRPRARLALALASALLAGAGIGACGGTGGESQSNAGQKGGGPQQANPGGLVSTGTPQPTITQPERPLTVPTTTTPVSPPPFGGP